MDETVWPLTESQILSLQAVEEKLVFWEQERQRRGRLVLQELARGHGEDPATLEGSLEQREHEAVMVIRRLVPTDGKP